MTEGSRGLRIALVSAFPPSTGPLSEYGWHLAECLRRHTRIERLHVLADLVPDAVPAADAERNVIRCWSFGGTSFPLAVIGQARSLDVDAVWFNMHLSSTGSTKASRFAGVVAPLVARLGGFVTVVTLHHMLGLTDLSETRLNASRLDLWGAHVGTRLLGAAHILCVPRPEYADLLRRHYRIGRVRYVPLGTPGTPLVAPTDAPRRGLLAFGHFGSNKRLEQVLEAVARLHDRRPEVRLIVGGTGSRYAPNYLLDLARQHQGRSYVSFLGYVPEAEVPALFQSVAVSLLPYGTVTGMSSVALQSAMYGAPILASDILGFRALEREGLRLRFYEWGDVESLKRSIEAILDMPECDRRSDAVRNLQYCQRHRMEAVVDEYLSMIGSLVVHHV